MSKPGSDDAARATPVTLDAPSAQFSGCTSASSGNVSLQPAGAAGVDYRVSGVRHLSSHVTVRVEATAQAGHRLSTGGTPWRQVDATHAVYRTRFAASAACQESSAYLRSVRADATRSSAATSLSSAPCGVNCVGPVVPAPPSFRDDVCVAATGQRSGASYVVPATRGVLYWVNGAIVPAGTYPARDGSTVTVVTSALSDYSLRGITQWTHTFADAPNCSGVGSSSGNTSSPGDGTNRSEPVPSTQHPADVTTHTPAYTGAPTGALLTVGSLLLLLGTVLCLVGARRRPQTSGTADDHGPTHIPHLSGHVGTTPARSAMTLARTLAGRLPAVLLPDPPAGADRTPPRSAPAAGRMQRIRHRVVPALKWRGTLTAADP